MTENRELPENWDRAIALLRRQYYHEVADYLEEVGDELHEDSES